MLKPLVKWLIETPLSVSTNYNHYRDTPSTIQHKLFEVLIDLVENRGVDVFYVGNQGHFDFLVRKILKELKEIHPHIKPFAVLAYMPSSKKVYEQEMFLETIYPENLEFVPYKFAILKRNEWMLNRSEYVVTYTTRAVGGAYHFSELSKRQQKTVINIADMI